MCHVVCFMQVNYIADSETEQVEWVSALEGAVAKIVRAVAGVEDEDHAPPPSNNSASNNSNWSSQLEKGFASMSKGGSSSNSSRPVGNAMVDIVGYGGGGGSGGHAAHRSSSMARDNGDYGSTSINYGQIAGSVSPPISVCAVLRAVTELHTA